MGDPKIQYLFSFNVHQIPAIFVGRFFGKFRRPHRVTMTGLRCVTAHQWWSLGRIEF